MYGIIIEKIENNNDGPYYQHYVSSVYYEFIYINSKEELDNWFKTKYNSYLKDKIKVIEYKTLQIELKVEVK